MTPDRSGNGYDNVAKAKNYDGKPKYYGRANIGVTTVNLADTGLSALTEADKHNDSDIEKYFWPIFDKRLEMCHQAQKIRAERVSNICAGVAPIMWCDGAIARLDPDEKLDKLVHGGFFTSSIGFAGLYECVKAVTGESHTQTNGKDFGLRVMQHMNDMCNKWKDEEDIDYSIYGSPIESTTYKFAKGLKKRFGIVDGITDRKYVTNSYHVPVFEKINAFEKLQLESEFQKLSPGGWNQYNLL